MANPHKGEFGFEVEGKQYVLRYSADTICDLEDGLKMTLNDISEQMQNPTKMRMSMVRTLFNAGLSDKHGDLDDAARRTLFRALTPVEAVGHVARAFALAFGVDGEGVGGAANPPQPGAPTDGTGPVSTPTGAG